MTVDALEYLRAQDPVPQGSSAPPLEWVLARIERKGALPARLEWVLARIEREGALPARLEWVLARIERKGALPAAPRSGAPLTDVPPSQTALAWPRPPQPRRIAASLVPAVAVAATLVVVAAVVVLAVTHRAHPPAHTPPATRTAPPVAPVPSPGSLMPRGGMHGTLFIQAAASPAAGHGLINFSQCQPCRGQGASTHLWQATTTDAGASWHVARASADLSMLDLSGADGWAEGIGPDRVARFYATHDGGRTWHAASSDAVSGGGIGNVSIAGGEVWSLGCTGTSTCTDTMLRAPAASDHLSRTAGQPPLGDTTNVSIVATGRDDAYVLTSDYGSDPKVSTVVGTRLFATHDGGHTWRRMSSACPAHDFGQLYAGGADSLWVLCQPVHGPSQVRRSTDGGAHWMTLGTSPSGDSLYPASAQVAWATTPAGKVLRTPDGGRRWTRVWYAGPRQAAPARTPPGLNRHWITFLTAQGPSTATVIVQVTRGHGHAARTDFVTYRTTDGGRTWRPSVVRLPAS